MLGRFGAAAASCLDDLRTGLKLSSLAPDGHHADKEIDLLLRRLAGHGLLEYRIGSSGNGADDLIVIEPQIPGYWPQMASLSDSDTLVLSRFAYMRRRGNEMVLEVAPRRCPLQDLRSETPEPRRHAVGPAAHSAA